MTVQINGQTKRIGLALSGGGFRAAAFHLGVFRRLESMGNLWNVDLLTSVSGGSIVGAFLAANWGQADTPERLQNYLQTQSIAVSSALGGIFDPFESRLEKLANSYDRDLIIRCRGWRELLRTKYGPQEHGPVTPNYEGFADVQDRYLARPPR